MHFRQAAFIQTGFLLYVKFLMLKTVILKNRLTLSAENRLGKRSLPPTKIYVKAVLGLLDQIKIKGISHITGGGFYENIPRSIPDGLSAEIERKAVRVLPIFDLIASAGKISERDMFNTFNMGIGMSITVSAEDADKALALLKSYGEDAYIIGEISTSSASDKISIK